MIYQLYIAFHELLVYFRIVLFVHWGVFARARDIAEIERETNDLSYTERQVHGFSSYVLQLNAESNGAMAVKVEMYTK